MEPDLAGRRVAFLVANKGVEHDELVSPWNAISEHHGVPELLAPRPGIVQTVRHLDRVDVFSVSAPIDSVLPSDYDAVVLPGGVVNADELRLHSEAVEFVRQVFLNGKPAAVICHGPWTIVEGKLVAGRTLTSWPSLRTDITNAGGEWVDEEVHVCEGGPNTLVSSRKPDDLPAFNAALLRAFSMSAPPARQTV